MDHFQHSKIQKHEAKHKKRLSENQVMLLESSFNHNNKLEPYRKTQLALDLGVPPGQVAVWYQNKRARDKIQGLELDHKTLQLELESVLADNARLKAEIEGLRLELNKPKQGSTFNSLNSTSSGDEVGSSKLERELYASLVGNGGHFVAPNGYDFFGD